MVSVCNLIGTYYAIEKGWIYIKERLSGLFEFVWLWKINVCTIHITTAENGTVFHTPFVNVQRRAKLV